GLAPAISSVRNTAVQVLAVRSGGPIGDKWASKLALRRPELKSRLTRQYGR
ncbi:hypothetical protein T440DRAFT_407454, partial [Plenodomus tracheiphilus IPT5]